MNNEEEETVTISELKFGDKFWWPDDKFGAPANVITSASSVATTLIYFATDDGRAVIHSARGSGIRVTTSEPQPLTIADLKVGDRFVIVDELESRGEHRYEYLRLNQITPDVVEAAELVSTRDKNSGGMVYKIQQFRSNLIVELVKTED